MNANNEEIKLDSVVSSMIQQFISRSRFGKQKYGTDMDHTDLSILEHMDAIIYLEKLKQLQRGT